MAEMDLNYGFYKPREPVYRRRALQASRSGSAYQRDFAGYIFLLALERLQNKTQVYPARKGRSSKCNRRAYCRKFCRDNLTEEGNLFYQYNLNNVIAAACLCHDIGNPAFGHSGEDAIASYFERNESSLKYSFLQRMEDLINFEGKC
ncbi:hypothetical protein FQR65_LT19636 [Abscondita terminalis]|nr:hypothetical protein FQR65_LT19636 [Abscondita terminalis]